MREKRYLFFSGKGSTHSPMGCEVNNEQYLGEAIGRHADEAYKVMVKEYPDIVSEGFSFDNCRWEELDTLERKTLRGLLMDCLQSLETGSTKSTTRLMNDIDMFRQNALGAYTVTTVSREDLHGRGYKSDRDDHIMQAIAADMQEVCTENNFWDSLDYACSNRGVETRDECIRGRYLRYKDRIGEYPTLAHVTIANLQGEEREDVTVYIGSSDELTEAQDSRIFYSFETIDELIEATDILFAHNVLIVDIDSIKFDKF